MRIHLAWIRVAASVAIVAGAGAQPSAAQYAPYRPSPQPGAPAAEAASPTGPRYSSGQAGQQAAPQAAAAPSVQTPISVDQYPQTSAAYVPAATAMPAYAPTPAYMPAPVAAQAAQTYPQARPYAPWSANTPSSAYTPAVAPYQPYPRVAYQQPAAPAAEAASPDSNGSDAMPAPAQPEAPMNGTTANGTSGQTSNGYMHYGQSIPSYSNGCNCATSGYPSSSCSGDQACSDSYGLSGYFDDPCHDSQWFGGVYYLFMERDRPSPRKLTVQAIDTATFPYWPASTTTVLVNSDHEYRSGVEVRFGSTFTIGGDCDSCNTGYYNDSGCNTGCDSCGSCCPPTLYAWEFAWWGLDDDENDVTVVPATGYGIYGMVNFAGLSYDAGGGGNPVNLYYGYALPIPAASDEILAQRARTNFQAQNFELNIIRFPVCNVSCGSCNSGCGCDSGCDPYGCEEECKTLSFSMCGSCGVRYFRADDDFLYATEFAGTSGQTTFDGWSGNVANELYYDIQVDNHLIGPQLGWTMNYCYSRWNFFMNSSFGVFNNYIEHNQRMWSGGGGTVTFAQTGEEFDVDSDKDDIAFLGELRLGGSYDFSCHWRGVLAYRAVAITGVATSTDQIPSDFSNAEWVGIIDSDSSMVVHGVQTGVECKY